MHKGKVSCKELKVKDSKEDKKILGKECTGGNKKGESFEGFMPVGMQFSFLYHYN